MPVDAEAAAPNAPAPLQPERGSPVGPEGVLLESADPANASVRVLALNRPGRRNALSPELTLALHQRLVELTADSSVRAVVLTGVGPIFCAGGDLGGGMGGDGFLAAHAARAGFARLLLTFLEGPLPVIAAVQGDALGGGFGLAMACRMVVAAAGARFGAPELRLGLFPMMIWPVLARNVPDKLLHELVLTDRRVGAAEAEARGLINAAVAAEDVLPRALELARAVADRSPAVVRLGLQAAAAAGRMPIDTALHHLHSQLSLNLMTEDAAEGIAAFLERRPPVWSGR